MFLLGSVPKVDYLVFEVDEGEPPPPPPPLLLF